MDEKRYTLRTQTRKRASLINYEKALNQQQYEVVEADEGHILVIAGAGSGKTRTLVYRVARLLEKGISPGEILLLTFTNRAAKHMLSRVRELVDDPGRASGIFGGTFHSAAYRTLRKHGHLLGYGANFGIMDQGDAGNLMKACIAEANLYGNERRFPARDVILKILSMAVNTQTPIADLIAEKYYNFIEFSDDIIKVARRFTERKIELDMMDFDDLLMNWKTLLLKHENVRKALGNKFRYVLIDEYQDTNRLQGDIVELISENHGNLMVVGDDAQSIYGFRGAHFANILGFPQRHPDCRIFRLTYNYRSTPTILNLANLSIINNRRQFEKELEPVRKAGERPALIPCRDVYQQADLICQRILELNDEGIDFNDIAVLYRAHFHSMELQMEMSRQGIPFAIRSGLRFFEQAHIKDVLSYLRFVFNPLDELAFKRIVCLRTGIGAVTAEKIWTHIKNPSLTASEPLGRFLEDTTLSKVPKRGRDHVLRLRNILIDISAESMKSVPGTQIRHVLENEYADYARSQWLNADSRLEDIAQLADFAAQFKDLETFLSDIGLLAGIEGENISEETEKEEAVTLTTIHKAKGLEWKVVFLICLSEGRFPLPSSLNEPESYEEERRLFYVAVTRAMDQLYLCCPIMNNTREGGVIITKPSSFITELPSGDEAPYEKWILDVQEEIFFNEFISGENVDSPSFPLPDNRYNDWD